MLKILFCSLFFVPAWARPGIRAVCQNQQSSFIQVFVCAEVDDVGGQIYGYHVLYRGGLLARPAMVLLGGIRIDGNYQTNIYDGEGSWANQPLSRQADGAGTIRINSGGLPHEVLALYFQSVDGRYDSAYGQNYRFQF